jgi:signal transduction histidine kinase/ligand-binding sensor domain-containing protein/DNA-binding response OmpR family regulator
MKQKFLILTMLAIANPVTLQGQGSEVRFHHIGVEDGLSHSLVSTIVEDSLGFLWFGTEDGLNRFDGYGFRTYYKGRTKRSPSDSWIIKLYVDGHNQLWIGYSGAGLERFDPIRENFHTYIPDTTLQGSISSNMFATGSVSMSGEFFEDSDGQLWIGTDDGLNLYSRSEDRFTRFKHDPQDPASLSDNQVITLFEDRKGFLWVGTKNGLNRMDRSTGKVKRFLPVEDSDRHLNARSITIVCEAPDGSIWVGTQQGGLNIITDPEAEESSVIHMVDTPLNPNHLPGVNNIVGCEEGNMLVATQHGLYRIFKQGDGYREELIPETRGISIYHTIVDSKGCFWASSDDNIERSLFRLSPDTRTIEEFGSRTRDPYLFGGGKVLALHESRTGLVWVGTEKHGIYFVDLNARQFRTIDNYPGRGLYISDNEVYSIYEDSRRQLYIGTKTELDRINLKDGTTRRFNNHYNLKRGLNYEYSDELASTLIGVMEEAPDGKIWMGSFDYKVSLYDPVRDRFLNFHLNEQDSTSFLLWSMRSICVTHDGRVYFGATDNGLCRLMPDGFTFEYFPVVNTGSAAGTNDSHIQYIFEDSEGILWLGTMIGGLNSFDPGKGTFRHYVHDPQNSASISSNRVKCILEPEIHGDEILWVGTNNGGLNRFDKITGTFAAFTMEEGLPSNTIHGILEDKVGNLWLSTNRGLVQFDPVTEKISIYTAEDGLVGNEFNQGAFFKNSEGVMYFGGTNGINYFIPEEIKEKPGYNAPVIFTGFNISGKPVLPGDTINGRVVLEQSIPYTGQITLTHKERFITFEFASLDMAAAGKIRYRYMLDGFEESWNEVDASQRFISYTNMPSGTYTLRVAGTNSDGTIFREPSEIILNVLPPFWQTSLFKLFIAVVILLIFLVILQIRTRMLEHQKKTLARQVEERTKDLREANRMLELKQEEIVKQSEKIAFQRDNLSIQNKLLEDQNDEIQRMAEKLHESDQMKLKFFTNISHEFRTPLTLIMGPTEKLLGREDFSDVPVVKQELELIYRNERRLFKLINQLLEVRRVESGNLKLAVAEDDIAKYLREIHQLFIPYAEKKQIDFRFKADPPSMKVLFDADKIEKIFYNLLSNAFKYTPVNGRIDFSMDKVNRDGSEWLNISVQDSGPGIPEEHLPHIFDRFFQISNKHRSARISSGIGLSLSRDLVLKHNGRIEVQSDPHLGTRFDVLIPVNREVYKKEEILVEPEADLTMEYISSMLETYEYSRNDHFDVPLVGEELFRILLVEDNLDLQKFLYNEMSHTYNVMLAQNGEEGLLVSRQNLPDLIISDIMMPEMDGLEFCRQIKSDELTSHIPVILLTAKSGDESEILGFESGADDYITKPFNPELLRLKVKNFLENRKQMADKFARAASYIPENIKITQIDQGFLEKFVKIVEDNIDDTELSGDYLACELGMSKGNLYKKLKTLTGMTVNIFIRTIRLKVAARLLKQGNYNISEVAYAVGFNNPKYFSTCFSELYSMSPKEYMK